MAVRTRAARRPPLSGMRALVSLRCVGLSLGLGLGQQLDVDGPSLVHREQVVVLPTGMSSVPEIGSYEILGTTGQDCDTASLAAPNYGVAGTQGFAEAVTVAFL